MAKNSLLLGASRAAKSLQGRTSRVPGMKTGVQRGSLEEVALRNHSMHGARPWRKEKARTLCLLEPARTTRSILQGKP